MDSVADYYFASSRDVHCLVHRAALNVISLHTFFKLSCRSPLHPGNLRWVAHFVDQVYCGQQYPQAAPSSATTVSVPARAPAAALTSSRCTAAEGESSEEVAEIARPEDATTANK